MLPVSLTRALEQLYAGQTTAVRLAEHALQAIESHRTLNAFLATADQDALLAAARDSDARHARGTLRSVIDGLPIAVKDNFVTESLPTTCGSRMLAGLTAAHDATAVSRLRRGGALIVGKTNMDEFGMGSAGLYSAFGPVLHPLDKDRVPGGSSSGSAVAVASLQCLGALGSDTGGSVRLPAAYCGVVGFKPSYGRISRSGLVAFASSLDTPGILARCVADCAALYQIVGGPDAQDSTTVDDPIIGSVVTGAAAGKTIGIPSGIDHLLSDSVGSAWDRAKQALADAGASLVAVDLPYSHQYAVPAYYILAPAEASSNLARYDGVRYGVRATSDPPPDNLDAFMTATRDAGFGDEVKRRIFTGTFVLSRTAMDSYYIQAQRVRRAVVNEYRSVFAHVDFVLTPTAPTAAPTVADAAKMDPVTMYGNDVMTVPASLAGLPAISVPAGHDPDGMPIGVQLVGPRLADFDVLSAALDLESRLVPAPADRRR